MFRKTRISLLLCALLVLSLSIFPSVVLAQSGAANAISGARSQLVSCWDAATAAEEAGANITALTEILNEAGLLLSRAEFAFSTGDFAGAQDYAVQSRNRLVNFASGAEALKVAAEGQRSQDFLINVVGSAGGTVAVLVASFALWSFLRRKHPNNGEREVGSATV